MNEYSAQFMVANRPTADELIDRAISLRPMLREQQAENAQRGTYSVELHQAFSEAGFYRITAPQMFGGHEHDLETFFRVMVEVATGDPSVGWCLALCSSHAWFVASHWPEAAQREFFSQGDFIAPHRAAPGGKLTPVEGGYRLSGTWNYSSGVPHSTYFIGNAILKGVDSAPPTTFCVAVPRKDFTILEDWGGDRTLGMLSSGSNTVTIDDVFLPADFAVPTSAYFMRASEMLDGTPGTKLHGNPMFLGRIAAPYNMAITSAVVGALKAMIDEFKALITSGRPLPFGQVSANEMYERALGTALVRADSCEEMLFGSARRYGQLCDRWAATGAPITEEDNLRMWGVCQEAGRIAGETIDMLYHAAMSSSTTVRGSRVARYLGDWLMYRAHPGNNLEMISAPTGRAHLGRKIDFMGL